MADVTLSNLRKSFGSVEVIPAISLDIADGEFIVLVGPSGCGKSTLLRMMAGLETISDGEFRIGDRRVNELDPKDRDVAMVFQNYALYPHMTVGANMGFSLEHRGATREQIAERVGWAAGILGLTHLLQRHPRQLSGGQRQRVAMGRAIVRDPQLFLFDEPLSNLDAKLRVVMRGEIKSLQRRLGTTMIYVTHDQVEAMTMADRVVVLNAGRVEQVGPPLVLYDRPVNRFVAGFIGSPAMNFLTGTVTAEGFRVGGAVLPLPGDVAVREGRSAVYGIRPEHLRIDPDGLDATIDLVEPTGSETQVTMTLAGVPLVGIFRERVVSEPGGTMRVSPQLQNVHLFSDDEDGVRLH